MLPLSWTFCGEAVFFGAAARAGAGAGAWAGAEAAVAVAAAAGLAGVSDFDEEQPILQT